MMTRALLIILCWDMAMAAESDSDGGTTHFSEGIGNLIGLVVAWEATVAVTCKLCGNTSTDESSVFTGARFMSFSGRRPWLHYRLHKDPSLKDTHKIARGRICAPCHSVMKQSGLLSEHNNIRKSMEGHNHQYQAQGMYEDKT